MDLVLTPLAIFSENLSALSKSDHPQADEDSAHDYSSSHILELHKGICWDEYGLCLWLRSTTCDQWLKWDGDWEIKKDCYEEGEEW